MAILEVKNLKKSFGAQEVLKGINFEMDKGEVVVIIGSSGSGKTTLLRCLNFLETADDGQIIVDGETLFDGASDKNEKYNDLRKKRLRFGLVFQQFNLFRRYFHRRSMTTRTTTGSTRRWVAIPLSTKTNLPGSCSATNTPL